LTRKLVDFDARARSVVRPPSRPRSMPFCVQNRIFLGGEVIAHPLAFSEELELEDAHLRHCPSSYAGWWWLMVLESFCLFRGGSCGWSQYNSVLILAAVR